MRSPARFSPIDDDSPDYWPEDDDDCPDCDGTGWYWDESDPINEPDGELAPCPTCNPDGSR